MKATLTNVTTQKVKVNNFGGVLTSSSPVTLKNDMIAASLANPNLEDLKDVDEVDVSAGSTIVYNAYNNKYEIKHLDFTNISGGLDGGTF